MDVARLGLAHETLDLALERMQRIRAVAAELGKPVRHPRRPAGPKVRAGHLPEDGVPLPDRGAIRLRPGTGQSTKEVISVDYEQLLEGIEAGDRLSFGDGAVVVEVESSDRTGLVARVIHGGLLMGRPGVHIPSDRLRVATPTPEDLRLLDGFVGAGVDMVALSFVRSAHDVRGLGTEPHPRGPLVVAKIETRAAVDNLAGILDAAGAVMIARGDLGIECTIEELPHARSTSSGRASRSAAPRSRPPRCSSRW